MGGKADVVSKQVRKRGRHGLREVQRFGRKKDTTGARFDAVVAHDGICPGISLARWRRGK
jgi:hypothetical protein